MTGRTDPRLESQSLPSGAWLVHGGRHSDLIARFEAEGFVALDCPDLGDPTSLGTRAELENWVRQKAPALPTDLQRRYACELFYFKQLMTPGDYVLTHGKANDELVVGLVRGGAEYQPGVLDTGHAYVRRVEWLTRLRRSDFTPAAHRDLYSLAGVNDLRPHLREIHQRLTGRDLGDSIELRKMSRGQVLWGDALPLDRTNPAQLILIRHRSYHARRLAGSLTVFGSMLVLLAACSRLAWKDPNAVIVILSLLAAGIGVNLLLALSRMWHDLRIAVLGEVLVLDHERRSLTKRPRFASNFDEVTAVELHTRTYVFEAGWTLAHPTAQGEILWLPASPTHLHHLNLYFNDRQEVLIDASEDLRQCLILAHACADFLAVPLLRNNEQIVVDNRDSWD